MAPVRFPASTAFLSLLLLPSFVGAVRARPGAAAPETGPTATLADTIQDLRALLDTGWILQDRNGDELVDFVDVRIVLQDAPTAAEAAAAANIAARLGYETSGSDLGLAVVETALAAGPVEHPVVTVGESVQLPARASASATVGDVVEGLAPGQGAIVHLPASRALPIGGAAVVGSDATGLLAASGYLSGRYPAVWDPEGDEWDSVPDRVRAFLEGRELSPGRVELRHLVVDASRPGVARAEVVVQAPSDGVRDAMRRALLAGGDSAGAGGPGPIPGGGPSGADTAAAGAPETSGAATPDTATAPAPDTAAAATPDSALAASAPDTIPPPDRASLHTRHLHRLDVRIVGPGGPVTVRLEPEEPWSTSAATGRAAGSGAAFTLSRVYEVGGLYRDTDRDLVPDETAAWLALDAGLPGTGGAEAASLATGVADLATRIGLETAGARFPLAGVTGREMPAGAGGLPVVVGTDPFAVERLLEERLLPGWSDAPGVGTVRVVPEGPAGEPLMLVTGTDDQGTAAALSWLAGRAPYLWAHGKGQYHLEEAETVARRFLQARGAPGQAALALHKLATWVGRLAEGRTMDGGPGDVATATDGGGDPGPAGSGAGPGGGPGGTGGAGVADAVGADGARGASGATDAGGVDDTGGADGSGNAHGAPAPDRIRVELAVEDAPPGLDRVARDVVRERLAGADVEVATFTTGFGVGDTVYHRAFDFGWEVDDVRAALADEVYPAVRAGQPARVEVRVSEPAGVRAALAEEIRRALEERGASPARATVLSAYKQGYSWIEDVVLPRLRELREGAGTGPDGAVHPIGQVRITYHTLEESDEIRWQTVAADTRWLQEIYPIDAVLSRELGIPDSVVTFHGTRRAEPIYTLTVTGPAGDTLLADAFDPKYVVRPFFDLFPEYERVRVTTGWVTATSGGDTLLDRRVETDPERFWGALQTDVYGRIVEYVMDIQDGEPSGSNAPYFDELVVRLRMSEPNRRIGVDEEVISSLEALHEDVYFETLTLFDLIGNRYGVGGLAYPGRVLPYIDPTGAGEPGTATVTLTGKEHGVPELVVVAERDGMEPERREYALQPLPVPEPPLRAVSVRAGAGGAPGRGATASPSPLASLLFEVEVVDSLDRYAEYRERSSEGAIDRTFPSAELLEGMLSALERMHAAGLYTETLAWDRVERTDVLVRVEDDSTWARVRSISRSDAPLSTDGPELLAEGWTWDGRPMVQWETPIPPAENDSILARLNTFPGVDVYYLTRSFLGQPVWAMDVLPPQPAVYVSQARLNARKPTLFISGRQHANEVSSTSHILRLAELLATDSTYRSYLDDVNVVLHPVTNPDGARLAVEMQETNPDFMLHAGYLGALGVDATAGERDSDPIYPESQARRRLRETWLPDAYVNMHGYPSHEWVQYFAGYSAWVRSRRGGARDWWAPRGWFVPGFRWVDDDENPEYTEAQMAMLDSVAASIRGLPEVAAMSDRLYARYRKYGREDREGFHEHFRGDVLMYLSLRGAESIGQGVYSPRITYFATTTEAPDETARGDWLELVASAGLAHATALLRYLAEGEYEVEREAEAVEGGVVRKAYRVKPVLPPEAGEAEGGASSGSDAAGGGAEGGDAAGGGG